MTSSSLDIKLFQQWECEMHDLTDKTVSKRTLIHRRAQKAYAASAVGKAYYAQWKAAHTEELRLHSRKSNQGRRAKSVSGHPDAREAYLEYRRRYRNKTVRAKNKGRRWDEADILLLFDDTYTDRELSKLLGRSMAAISTKRTNFIDRAPEGWTSKGSVKIL